MSNYTENQYYEVENNNWSVALDLLGQKEKILDIGCSSGNFGTEIIKRKGGIVDGVDIDAKDIQLAKKKLRHTYLLDIETDSLAALKEKYDVVLLLDVIEHFRDPVAALKRIRKLLKPKGRLIFSVPNMAHISVRLELLLGHFNYNQVGLLDYTHLHFYTEESLKNIIKDAGYSLFITKSTSVSYPEQLLDIKLKEAGLIAAPDFKEKLNASKGNVYQFVGVAKPDGLSKNKLSFPSRNPNDEHYLQVERAMRSQTAHIKAMEDDIKEKNEIIADINSRISKIVNSRSYKVAVKLSSIKRHVTKNRRNP